MKAVPSVTLITVCPIASSALVVVTAVSSNAVALGQTETPMEFPHSPAVLAAHSPTEPCPSAKESS